MASLSLFVLLLVPACGGASRSEGEAAAPPEVDPQSVAPASLPTLQLDQSTANTLETTPEGLLGSNVLVNGSCEMEAALSLQGVTAIQGDLMLNGVSDELLATLADLERVGGDLRVTGSKCISTLAGLASLRSVGGSLVLEDLNKLEDIEALYELESVGGDIVIGGNMRFLPDCHAPHLEQSLGSGLSGKVDAANAEGRLSIQRQEELDAFGELGCKETSGELRVVNEVTSLSPLSSLVSVGKLRLGADHVRNLNGLGSLRSVAESLVLSDLDSLETAAGMSSLVEVDTLKIQRNPVLGSVYFPALEEASIVIKGNPKLTEMQFPALTTAPVLLLCWMEELEDAGDYPALTEVNRLDLCQLPQLKSVDGFSALKSLGKIYLEAVPGVERETLEGLTKSR